MRLNVFIAQGTGLSRRAADSAIAQGRVAINDVVATLGQQLTETDQVTLDGKTVKAPTKPVTIIINKPVGYVCSKDGQGSKTVYDLLPPELQHVKSVGRLDKDSSGLLVLTSDGKLANELTHPKFEKIKKYNVAINKDLDPEDYIKITKTGVMLDDGLSKFNLNSVNNDKKEWKVEMREGRNRQIRRTFDELGYNVVKLHRTQFGKYKLSDIKPRSYKRLF